MLIEVQGDTMRMLYAPRAADGARPTSFDSANPGHMIMQFKRDK